MPYQFIISKLFITFLYKKLYFFDIITKGMILNKINNFNNKKGEQYEKIPLYNMWIHLR